MATCDYAQLTFFSPDGGRLGTTNRMGRFRWSRKINSIGAAEVLLSLKEFDFETYTRPDTAMVVEYGNSTGSLKLAGETVYFLVGYTEAGGLNEEETLTLRFEDAISLLNRRIVAYRHNTPVGSSPQAYINEPASDALVRLFRENLGDLVVADRSLLPRVGFVPSGAATPQVSKDFPWKNLLTTMKEICRTSRDQGVPLYFDLVPRIDQNGVNLTFQTFINQRGNDRRGEGIIRSIDPLFDLVSFEADFRLPNVAYAAGSGRGRDRLLRSVTNPRSTRGFFSRWEAFKSVQSANVQTLTDEASEIVNNTAGIYNLDGRLLDELGERYEWGDRLTVQHRDLLIDSEIAIAQGEWNNQVHTEEVVVRSRE